MKKVKVTISNEGRLSTSLQVKAIPFTGNTDGTATPETILEGYTAWVNGAKITGNLDISDAIAEAYSDGLTDGREQIIDEQSDATLTDASHLFLNEIAYSANNTCVVGTFDKDVFGEEQYEAGRDSIVLQEKTVAITQNGQNNIFPDSGNDGMSKVTVNVNVQDDPGEGMYRARTIDPNTGVHKLRYYDAGYTYVLPQHPEHEHLVPAGYTYTQEELTNLDHDIDVGFQYDTEDGRDYFKFNIPGQSTNYTLGFRVRVVQGSATIHWPDGTTNTVNPAATPTNFNHVFPASFDREFWVSVERNSPDTIVQYGGNNNSAYYITDKTGVNSVLTKAYFAKDTILGIAALNSHYSCGVINFPLNGTTVADYSVNTAGSRYTVVPRGYESLGINSITSNSTQAIIALPPTLLSILANAISNSYSFADIIFPASLISMGNSIAVANYSCLDYIFLGEVPPTTTSTTWTGTVMATMKFWVRDNAVNTYKTTTNWNTQSAKIFPRSQKPAYY